MPCSATCSACCAPTIACRSCMSCASSSTSCMHVACCATQNCASCVACCTFYVARAEPTRVEPVSAAANTPCSQVFASAYRNRAPRVPREPLPRSGRPLGVGRRRSTHRLRGTDVTCRCAPRWALHFADLALALASTASIVSPSSLRGCDTRSPCRYSMQDFCTATACNINTSMQHANDNIQRTLHRATPATAPLRCGVSNVNRHCAVRWSSSCTQHMR
jgi:hypothetical protein